MKFEKKKNVCQPFVNPFTKASNTFIVKLDSSKFSSISTVFRRILRWHPERNSINPFQSVAARYTIQDQTYALKVSSKSRRLLMTTCKEPLFGPRTLRNLKNVCQTFAKPFLSQSTCYTTGRQTCEFQIFCDISLKRRIIRFSHLAEFKMRLSTRLLPWLKKRVPDYGYKFLLHYSGTSDRFLHKIISQRFSISRSPKHGGN